MSSAAFYTHLSYSFKPRGDQFIYAVVRLRNSCQHVRLLFMTRISTIRAFVPIL